MPVYKVADDQILDVSQPSFADLGIREREDLQRWLRSRIEVIAEDCLVISEEFRDWEDSKRRIDLLLLDKHADLVVVELKRTEDGGFMDLQAIRYSSMVSTMTFERAVEAYQAYTGKLGVPLDAHEDILEFLGWEEPDEDAFAQAVRLILVSADFSRELTTSVLWLNEQGLDIRCVRLKPYRSGDQILLDIQQVIPLPEAEDYITGVRQKTDKERIDRAEKQDRARLLTEFWSELLPKSNARTDRFANISPGKEHWLNASIGVPGTLATYVTLQFSSSVFLEFNRDKTWNKAAFDMLAQHRREIDAQTDYELVWERKDDRKSAGIGIHFTNGGYRSDKSEWPRIQDQLVEAIIELERVFGPFYGDLRGLIVEPAE